MAANLFSRGIEESEVAAEAIPRIVHGIVAKVSFLLFRQGLVLKQSETSCVRLSTPGSDETRAIGSKLVFAQR